MSTKAIRISIVLLSLLALLTPSPAKSQAAEAFVSTAVSPASLLIGETASVSVILNNVPVEGYKSAEFTCTYDGALVEKSNIAVTDLFGAEPVTVIHDPQIGTFIVAIAGANSNRATTGGTAFTFSAKGLSAGQSTVQCAARVSQGDNLAIDVPSVGATLTILAASSATATPDGHEHPTPIGTAVESPTPLPPGSLSGQLLASKPVTVRLLDANQVEVASVAANPDGTFTLTPPPGDYTLVATASGFLSYQGTLTITDGDETVFPPEIMLAGDVDGNNTIDQFDALTIGMSYTTSTPEAADLNDDGVIDFLDLELLAENYRQTGPTTGSPSFLSYLRKRPTPIWWPTRRPTKTAIAPTATKPPQQTVIAPTATKPPQQTVIAPTATKPPQQTVIAPTATSSPIPIPTQTTLPGSNSMQLWHTPGAHDGLNPHEHGDKPPAWADDFSQVNFGHPVIFGGDERSGEMEVTMKHQAFKGVAYRVNGGSSCPVDVYFRYHAASNPMDRAFAFHSYELYMRDCQGGTSFRQGVYWVGYPEFKSQRMSRYNEQPGTTLPDGSSAPGRDQFILSAPDNRDWSGSNGILQTRCEQWYAFAGPHGGEFSITICEATTRFSYGEHLTNYHDMSTWDLTGSTGLGRRFEISLYGPNSPVPTTQPAGWFCALKAPIEDKVEGPTHRPRWTLITNGINGPTGCPAGYLPQFTAPTFPNTGINSTIGNTLDTKTFPGAGIVTVPN